LWKTVSSVITESGIKAVKKGGAAGFDNNSNEIAKR
jgi:hypothetical protein